VKRILLITYYFPPCGGAAVQRWLRLIPELSRLGYKITVLTTRDGDYPVIDQSLMKRIPAEVEIIRTYTPTFGTIWKSVFGQHSSLPYGSLAKERQSSLLAKIICWIRINLIIPDARVIWNPFAVKAAKHICRTRKIDWVITTGPPHSTHLIGLKLKSKYRIKWMADFRDPWSRIFYITMENQNRLVKLINRHLEAKMVRTADINLVVSQFISDSLPEGNKQVLYNGYDQNQFNKTDYEKGNKFRIKYIGSLTGGQDIRQILEYLERFVNRYGISDLELVFVGTMQFELRTYSYSYRFTDFLSHDEAVKEMVNSEMLVLLINNYDGNQGMLTTKLFEYLASQTPILCLGPVAGEAARIITEARAGVTYHELSDDFSFVLNLYEHWKASNVQRNDCDVRQWSVQQQINIVAGLLD
jgi:glycosyltransferase involved in cell wall biosynthesis